MKTVTDYISYMESVTSELSKKWPDNNAVSIACHGHSVPAGYFATPFVNSFDAYPHLFHKILKERFPFAVTNVIVTAKGGEHSADGQKRFVTDVLNHNPSVITIDYGLNDRAIGLEKAKTAWEKMIEQALSRDIKVILLTPSWERSYFERNESWNSLISHAEQIRELADMYNIGLADVYARFREYVKKDSDLIALLSHVNHPSKLGHELIAKELGKFFSAR